MFFFYCDWLRKGYLFINLRDMVTVVISLDSILFLVFFITFASNGFLSVMCLVYQKIEYGDGCWCLACTNCL